MRLEDFRRELEIIQSPRGTYEWTKEEVAPIHYKDSSLICSLTKPDWVELHYYQNAIHYYVLSKPITLDHIMITLKA